MTDIDAIEARLLGHCPPIIPDGVTDCTAGLQFKADVAAIIAEIWRLRKALQEIERFGHNEGHGRGYTCANMAAEALEKNP